MIKQTILILALLGIILFPQISEANYVGDSTGYILLQVEDNGEAWYVYPINGNKYYLGRPEDAFKIMRTLALGAKHDFIANTNIFPERLSGMILLDAETNGEAYYIYPENNKKYYLGRPEDAFKIMSELGRGVNNLDLANIPVGVIGEPIAFFDIHKKVLINNVPFTTQAPFGDWADQRQQDGCEESSSLMAVKWARGQNLTKKEALNEITGISDWLLKKYGEYRDISAQNTVDWIFKDYFNYDEVALVKNITVNDIIEELDKGNLVITPMNGQMMHNPNYKTPGPPRHMIVIRGYDPAIKEFITNDPGTRNGELYRYDKNVLYEAIRDYPTGYHEIITNIEKNMIVVTK
ncbi:MAG: C39 family peptidase [bacterium]